jgi:hypothetical protein
MIVVIASHRFLSDCRLIFGKALTLWRGRVSKTAARVYTHAHCDKSVAASTAVTFWLFVVPAT